MPQCKTCGNNEWFFGSTLAQLRALVKTDEKYETVQNAGTVVVRILGPITLDTCAHCASKELAWPEVEIPF